MPNDNKAVEGVECACGNVVHSNFEHDRSDATLSRLRAHGIEKDPTDAGPSVFAQHPEREDFRFPAEIQRQGEPDWGFFSPFDVTKESGDSHDLRNSLGIPRILGKASLVQQCYRAARGTGETLDAAPHSRLPGASVRPRDGVASGARR